MDSGAPFLAFSTLIIGLIIMPLCLIGLPNFASRVFATAWARLNSAVSILSVELQGAEHIAQAVIHHRGEPSESYRHLCGVWFSGRRLQVGNEKRTSRRTYSWYRL